MEDTRNRGVMLRLAETPQGLRLLQLMGEGGQTRGPNRLTIGGSNGPHGYGIGGREYDVSLSQVSNYKILGA